jgi:hypothetical protein
MSQYDKYYYIYYSLDDTQQKTFSITISNRVKTTLYYTFLIFLSHFIMLILMTYNFWIICAMIIGHGIGYYLFHLNQKNKNSKIPPISN